MAGSRNRRWSAAPLWLVVACIVLQQAAAAPTAQQLSGYEAARSAENDANVASYLSLLDQVSAVGPRPSVTAVKGRPMLRTSSGLRAVPAARDQPTVSYYSLPRFKPVLLPTEDVFDPSQHAIPVTVSRGDVIDLRPDYIPIFTANKRPAVSGLNGNRMQVIVKPSIGSFFDATLQTEEQGLYGTEKIDEDATESTDSTDIPEDEEEGEEEEETTVFLVSPTSTASTTTTTKTTTTQTSTRPTTTTQSTTRLTTSTQSSTRPTTSIQQRPRPPPQARTPSTTTTTPPPTTTTSTTTTTPSALSVLLRQIESGTTASTTTTTTTTTPAPTTTRPVDPPVSGQSIGTILTRTTGTGLGIGLASLAYTALALSIPFFGRKKRSLDQPETDDMTVEEFVQRAARMGKQLWEQSQ